MTFDQLYEGCHVFDPLPSLGFGVVVKVYKKSVHVKFPDIHGKRVVYSLSRIQFLQPA